MMQQCFEVAQWVCNHALNLLHPSPDCIALFGSFTQGRLQRESDVDLLLVGDQIPMKPSERSRWVHNLLDAWRKEGRSLAGERVLSPLILSRKGWRESIGLRLSLSDHLWILHDDGLLSSTLGETRQWISDRLWERRPSRDGGWLWIPQNNVKGAA